MSSLPPSSTPPEGDDSAPVSLPAADAAPESSPVAAAAAESPPSGDDAAPAQPEGQAAAKAQEDCGPQLKQLFPALFSNPPKPLKLRIQADIQVRAPGQFTKPQLSAFLRRYTGSHAYLNALVKATHRFDLDGNAGDELSDEHRTAAGEELARRRANTQARIALEQEQRANRATLLKEFEANTLPAAEFAAAKGIAEPELEPLIARARKEALEPPPAPAFNRDRRGPNPNRGPRPEGQRNARPPRDAKAQPAADGAAPQADAPRAPRPPRADGPRGPRTDAPRGPRPDAPRNGPRPDGRGPRADGPRGSNNGPRSDAPRGPRRDDDRRPPRPDDTRAPRPNVSSTPAAPTAMALAFSALSALKTKK